MAKKSGQSGNKATLTIPEAALRLGIAKNSAYLAAAKGQIPIIRIGRLMLVPKAAFEKMLEGRAA